MRLEISGATIIAATAAEQKRVPAQSVFDIVGYTQAAEARNTTDTITGISNKYVLSACDHTSRALALV